MIAIHCTRKLLERVGPPRQGLAPSTSPVDDWYATLVEVDARCLVLVINGHSHLPVVLPCQAATNLPQRLPEALADVLLDLEMLPSAICHQVSQMREAVITTIDSRFPLETLNDLAFQLEWQLQEKTLDDLTATALWLAGLPAAAPRLGPAEQLRRTVLMGQEGGRA